MLILSCDVETTGKFKFKKPAADPCQPRIVSMGVCLFDSDTAEEVGTFYTLIKPEGFEIPEEAVAVHGITTEKAMRYGVYFNNAYELLRDLIFAVDRILIFNEQFDRNVLNSELLRRAGTVSALEHRKADIRCMMLAMAGVMKQPGQYGDYKWPKLAAAYEWLYQQPMVGAHGALADSRATGWIALTLVEQGLWSLD